jgi:hypothetical protein
MEVPMSFLRTTPYPERVEPDSFASPGINPWEVLDTLPEYIAVVDMQGTIQYLNATWYQLVLERSVGDVGFTVGSNYLASFQAAFGPSGADVQAMEEGVQAVLYGREDRWVCQYPYDQTGEQRWFTATITPTYMANGSRGALIRQIDTTTSKQTEERLRNQHTSLEAVRCTARRFLKSPELNSSMSAVLEYLSTATGLSRACAAADIVAAATHYHYLELEPFYPGFAAASLQENVPGDGNGNGEGYEYLRFMDQVWPSIAGGERDEERFPFRP